MEKGAKGVKFRAKIMLIALFITVFLLVCVLLVASLLDQKRKDYVAEETQKIYQNLNEMQTFMLMSETYGNEMACLAFDAKLKELDRTIWETGLKIDQYRIASEDFVKSPYYRDQKVVFNENEIFYMMLLQKLKRECEFNQVTISFFYIKAEECKKCDDQSFVLTDINKIIDPEVAIFSYDMDLNVTSVGLLAKYYNVTEYPCLIIEEEKFCGMQDKALILSRICQAQPETSICV